MSYWETADRDPALSGPEREFAALWRSLPKVVFSRTLSAVEGSYRLATGSLQQEVEGWRARPGTGDIGVGGATLAWEAADLGLVDEYGLRVHPVLVGGGTPFFPRTERRADLELVDSRRLGSGVMALRYRVRH
jgi:dihydrofolate reductase